MNPSRKGETLAKIRQRITDASQMNLTTLVCRIDTRDIKIGKPDDPRQCAAAKALNRRLKKKFRAVVTQTDLWILNRFSEAERFRCTLPPEMQKFVCDFDNGILPLEHRINFYLSCPKEFLHPKNNYFSVERSDDPFTRMFIEAMREELN